MQRRTVLKLALGSIAAAATPSWAVESASQVTLYKDAQCDCCGAYGDYLRDNDFTVAIVETPHLPMMYARCSLLNPVGVAASGNGYQDDCYQYPADAHVIIR